ncbi:MAG: DUF1615 domain-containing protein [Xanthomonadales bacterium]|nr:DUF1615 domain-containing protein [Xanthomonadales bacterium]
MLQTSRIAAVVLLIVLAGCASQPPTRRPAPRPDEVRALATKLLPPGTGERAGWAQDIAAAFAALRLDPTAGNLCAAIAVIAQESGFVADPVVPNLGRLARTEIERRAAAHHVPRLAVTAALKLKSPDGRSWGGRIDRARTERELSAIFQELIARVPLGERLFADANPVHTGGPMQVSIAFAESHAGAYPYPRPGSVRDEVFTRRGGLYFGIAHLLDYPARYPRMLYRFADYNAGWYASRNAAFQNAVSRASGIPLALDGDLVAAAGAGPTEVAVRALKLDFSDRQVRRMLEEGRSADFEDGRLWRAVFERADGIAGAPLPRAMVPKIRLESPKITRQLTTAWFAERVDTRYRQCLARAPATAAAR